MATKVFTNVPAATVATYQVAEPYQGLQAFATAVTNTVTGPTAGVQVTKTAGGANLAFITSPIAVAVTISASITFNVWGFENSNSANAGMECRVIKYTGGAESTSVIDSEKGTELPLNTAAAQNWSATPGSGVAFAVGDRIVIKWFINDVGTMASGHTTTNDYGGRTSGADGDSWVQFTEAIAFQQEFTFDMCPGRDSMPKEKIEITDY